MVDETNLSSSDEDSGPETVSNPFGSGVTNVIQTVTNPFGSGVASIPQTITNPFVSGVGNTPQTVNNPFGSGGDNPSQINNPLVSAVGNIPQGNNSSASGVSNSPQLNRPFRTRWGPPLSRPIAIEDGPVSPNGGLTNSHSYVNEWRAPHPTDFNPLYAPPDDETDEEAEANPPLPSHEVVDEFLDEDEDLYDPSDEDEGASGLYGNSQGLEVSLDAIMAEGNEEDKADEDAYLDEV